MEDHYQRMLAWSDLKWAERGLCREVWPGWTESQGEWVKELPQGNQKGRCVNAEGHDGPHLIVTRSNPRVFWETPLT